MDDRTGRLDVPNATAAADGPPTPARVTSAPKSSGRGGVWRPLTRFRRSCARPISLRARHQGAADKVKDLASTATEKVKDMASTTTEKVKDMASNVAGTTEEWWDANSDTGFIGRIRNNPLPPCWRYFQA